VLTRETLLVVGSNPPSQTSGQRTLARIEQARIVLGFEKVVLANLFALPTYRSGGVSELGQVQDGWQAARSGLKEALDDCSGVLLAYGVGEPTGKARILHREQVAWLDDAIKQRSLPTWWVGGAPRHPSRWQRYTWRQHPGIAFHEALSSALDHIPGTRW
jgi:hypothetical protein